MLADLLCRLGDMRIKKRLQQENTFLAKTGMELLIFDLVKKIARSNYILIDKCYGVLGDCRVVVAVKRKVY